jgi:hypothetical protein
VCVHIPYVTRKYHAICPIVMFVNKHFCVVVNTVITWTSQSLNVWKYGQLLNFCANIGKTPTYTYNELKRASGTSSASRRLVFKWHKGSVEGRESIDDDKRSGRHPSLMPWHVTRVVQYIRALVEYVTCTLHKNTINCKILSINYSSIDSKTNYKIKANATLQATNN